MDQNAHCGFDLPKNAQQLLGMDTNKPQVMKLQQEVGTSRQCLGSWASQE